MKPLPPLHTVTAIRSDCSLVLESGDDGALPRAGDPGPRGGARLLLERVLKKRVFLRDECAGVGSALMARIILKNRISINAQLVKSGAARAVGSSGR